MTSAPGVTAERLMRPAIGEVTRVKPRSIRVRSSAALAALEAAKLRFRPILMTAFAFILGVVPLLTASGAGAEARKVMGMTVFSGMLIATLIGVCLIPVLFVTVEKVLQWRRGPEDRPTQGPLPVTTTDAH